MAATDVLIRFIADTTQAGREVEGFGSKLKGFAGKATAALGGVAIGALAKDSLDAAATFETAMRATQVVFGESSGAIVSFAENAATNLGISKTAALDAASSYGNLFTQIGFTTAEASAMSQQLLILTSDLAAFKGADPSQVLEAQQAAFRGEYDALQKFIPTINAATVEQRALADRTADTVGPLTDAEKAAATFKIIMEGAGSAAGAFAENADTAAVKSAIMGAQIDDAQVSIGQALQPALQVVTPMIAKLAEGFANLESPLQTVIVLMAGLAVVAALVGGWIGLIVFAVGLVIAALYLLWTNWNDIWTWIMEHKAYAAIIAALVPAIAFIFLLVGAIKFLAENWGAIWDWIKTATTDAADWIVEAFRDVIDFFQRLPGQIAGFLSGVGEIITAPFRWAVDQVKNIVGDIKGAFSEAIGFVKGIWNGFARAWNGIQIKIPSVDIPLVGEIGGGSVSLPNLPILARGGIVTAPTLALIGEAGPEAVVPLSRMGTTTVQNTYTIEVYVAPGASGSEVGAGVVDAIRSYERVNGSAWRAS